LYLISSRKEYFLGDFSCFPFSIFRFIIFFVGSFLWLNF